MADTHPQLIYYINDCKQITGKSGITLRRWWEDGKFPKPIKLHSSVLAWNASTIHNWINENIPEDKNE